MKIKLNQIICFILVFVTSTTFAQDKIKFGYHDASGKAKSISKSDIVYDEVLDTVIKSDISKSIIDTLDSLGRVVKYDSLSLVVNNLDILSESDTITISVLLPFYLNENESLQESLKDKNIRSHYIFNKSRLAISFLEGILLAVDSLENIGIYVKLNVFDTEKDKSVVRRLVVENKLHSSQLIFGPLYPEVFKVVKNYYRSDTNKILINPLSSKVNLLNNSRNVYFLSTLENLDQSLNLVGSQEVVLVSFQNKKSRSLTLIKNKLSGDSVIFKEFNFQKLEDINKESCQSLVRDSTLLIIKENNISFVNRILSFCSLLNNDIVILGDFKWKNFLNMNIENLMNLKVHIPVSNYFNKSSVMNKGLLQLFEKKYNHQMNEYSILSFKSILHFCSDKKQFSFSQFSKNGGFINIDVKMCIYKDYNLLPIK